MKIDKKVEKVKEILKDKKIALGFSGGADSTLIAHLAKEVCSDVLLITYDTKIFPKEFLEFTKKKANELELKHIIVNGSYLDIDNFVNNPPDRCYICRDAMYGKIKEIAEKYGYETLVDGNNLTDLTHDRPGILIKYKYDFLSPFIQACLESDEIHMYNEKHNFKYSKNTTCLATRIKTNEKITDKKIKQIDYCEHIIRKLTNNKIKIMEANNTLTIQITKLGSINEEVLNKIRYNIKKNTTYNDIIISNLPYIEDKLIQDYEIEEIKNKYNLKKQLPYPIDIQSTKKVIEEYTKYKNIIKNVEKGNDYITFNLNNHDVKITNDGKVFIKNLKSKTYLKENFIIILPLIRRIK